MLGAKWLLRDRGEGICNWQCPDGDGTARGGGFDLYVEPAAGITYLGRLVSQLSCHGIAVGTYDASCSYLASDLVVATPGAPYRGGICFPLTEEGGRALWSFLCQRFPSLS